MKIQIPNFAYKQYAFGSISLCMIMKNEEKRLARCLNSVSGLANEVIIVDTGSTDRSVKIARKYGAKVFFDKWQDDFARPRNISISAAKSSWIFILDPDEVIDRKDIIKIKELTLNKEFAAFRMTTKNYTGARVDPGFIPLEKNNIIGLGFAGYTPSTKTRFFKNDLGIKFKGCYHELVDYDLAQKKLPIKLTSIPIHHWNHEINQKTHKEKIQFYLRMAEKKLKQEPENLHAWWEAAVTYAIAGWKLKAIWAMKKSMSGGHTDEKRLFTLARLLKLTGSQKQSRIAFEKGVCILFPNLTHADPHLKPLNILQKKA